MTAEMTAIKARLEEMAKPHPDQAAIDAAGVGLLGQSLGKGWVYTHSKGPWHIELVRGQLVIVPWIREA